MKAAALRFYLLLPVILLGERRARQIGIFLLGAVAVFNVIWISDTIHAHMVRVEHEKSMAELFEDLEEDEKQQAQQYFKEYA